jgi:NitT/TauT family transport system substrate-binding protein
MERIRGFITLVVAMLIMALSLVACVPAKPPQQFTLRIGSFASMSNLPYFVIQELGFAEQNSLQLLETPYAGGAAIIEDIEKGILDLGVAGTVTVISLADSGLVPDHVLMIASVSFSDAAHPDIGVLIAKNLNNWQDLRGQYVNVNALNGLPSAAIQARFKQEKVEGYKLMVTPLANMGLSVAGGNTAAAAMNEPYLTQSLLRGDGKLLDWIIGGPPFVKFQNTGVVASTDMYRNNPQAVKAFLRAYLSALGWINQNPDGARSVLAKKLNISPEVIQKIRLPLYSTDARNDPTILESIQPVLIDTGYLKAIVPASKLYDETLLNEVLSEK